MNLEIENEAFTLQKSVEIQSRGKFGFQTNFKDFLSKNDF